MFVLWNQTIIGRGTLPRKITKVLWVGVFVKRVSRSTVRPRYRKARFNVSKTPSPGDIWRL